MVDYIAIYNRMEDGKEYTASSLGVAPASMTAMVRRNLVTVAYAGSPKRYVKAVESSYAWVNDIIRTCLPKDQEFFTLHKKDEKYGMLCTIKNGVIHDCWGNAYNLTDIVSVEINHIFYNAPNN